MDSKGRIKKMTTYKVMAKGKYDKRFHCYGNNTESKHADKHAESLVKSLWTKEVKIIVNDGYTKETLIYKAA